MRLNGNKMIRIPKAQLKEIGAVARRAKVSDSALIRMLCAFGLREIQNGSTTIGQVFDAATTES